MLDPVPRGSTQVELNFYESPADGELPYQYAADNFPTDGRPSKNYGQPAIRIPLIDIRGHEADYTLDKDAFQAVQGVLRKTAYESFLSEDLIKEQYYPEVISLVLEHLDGAQSAIIFDHVVRTENRSSHSAPLFTAHVDQTSRAAAERVRVHVKDPAQAEHLLKGRYRIVNVWKPLKGPVCSTPLAFASVASVDPSDLKPIEFRLKTRNGEIVGVQYNDQQHWMYWSGMRDDECLLLKCNDTKKGVAQQIPHSAFHDSRTPENADGRESIEVRVLVFG